MRIHVGFFSIFYSRQSEWRVISQRKKGYGKNQVVISYKIAGLPREKQWLDREKIRREVRTEVRKKIALRLSS